MLPQEITEFRRSAGKAAEPYRPAIGEGPETVDRHNRARDRRRELQAMIIIKIFKENHRFSN
jgi:hypothetical protein